MIQTALFPFLIGSSVVAAVFFYHTDIDPELWILYIYNGAAILLTIAEYVAPRNASWNYWSKDGFQFKEAALETGFYFYGEALGKAFLLPIASWVVGHLRAVWDIPPVAGVSNLSKATQIVLLFFIIDLIRYWIHRWQHSYGILWRFHALHHMAPRLGAMSATRSHPIDDLLLYLPETILILLLGFDVRLVAGMYSVIWVVSLVKHANVDLKADWVSRFFQLPRYHLIHHELHGATDPTHNFAEITVLWDRVFGTFRPGPVTPDHAVGVVSRDKRGVLRELFGGFYLPVERM